MSYLPIKIGGVIMYLYELIEKYGKGASNEKMQKLTMILSDFLAPMKQVHKEKYWMLMRDVFGLLNDYHYDDEFAEHDVSDIEYTDRKGEKRQGAYWTMGQIKEATKEYKFPSGVTDWDMFVAFNAMYADTCKKLEDKQILDAAYSFFFNDEDWDSSGKSATKIWHYMRCKHTNSMK